MKIKSLLKNAVLFFVASCLLTTIVSAQGVLLYGMTEQGGANNLGVIFQFNTSDSAYAKKFDFSASNGSNPFGSLMQASDGKLYGMTYNGGTSSDGVLFQYNPGNSMYTKKVDFSGTSNGSNPRGTLIQASDGNLYGMTEQGGANAVGVIFQYDPSTSGYNKVYDFGVTGVSGPINGYPYGALMQASDLNLYGTTYQGGGTYNDGVLFQFTPSTSTYTGLHNFGVPGVSGAIDGTNPIGSLVQANDGNIYGMTYGGGTASQGTLYKYNPDSATYVTKINFGALGITGTTSGIFPCGALVQATDGNLYGLTNQGGATGEGALFQYNPTTSTYVQKVDFGGTTNGANPYGTLIQASDGNLYGMTKGGGVNGFGVIFKYNPTSSTCTKFFDFTGADGQFPWFSNLTEIPLTTGMKTFFADNNISLVPNPATDQISVKSGSSHAGEAVTVTIVNVLGEIITQEKLSWSNDINLSTKDIPAGVYFLQLKTEKENIVKRFVKE